MFLLFQNPASVSAGNEMKSIRCFFPLKIVSWDKDIFSLLLTFLLHSLFFKYNYRLFKNYLEKQNTRTSSVHINIEQAADKFTKAAI